MLEVRDVHAGYGRAAILRGVTLDIAEGEIVAVLGANGAGKTTLNGVLSGVVPATAGRITFDGEDITRAGHVGIVARGLVQVPEGRRIFPNLTVRENLILGSYRRGAAHRSASLERVLGEFPRLRERVSQPAGTLSGGEQQMLAIGRGLMAEPRLLVLDEPSLGLSPLLVEQMFALVRQLNAGGLSILLVEQNVAQTLAIASRAFVLENGAIAFHGAPRDLLGNPALRRAYLGI